MPRERVCSVPPRASDKESGIAFIALFGARWDPSCSWRQIANRTPPPQVYPQHVPLMRKAGRRPPCRQTARMFFLPWTTLLISAAADRNGYPRPLPQRTTLQDVRQRQPSHLMDSSNSAEKMASRSCSRYAYRSSQPAALTSCCRVHCAVGYAP